MVNKIQLGTLGLTPTQDLLVTKLGCLVNSYSVSMMDTQFMMLQEEEQFIINILQRVLTVWELKVTL
jgi:hypothetical protein